MMRTLSIILCITLAVSLAGCHSQDQNSASFYYCRDPQQYQYFDSDSVILPESRDIMGHQGDLKYMVGLYLAGPMEEGLLVPFSKSTKLLSVQQAEDIVQIELSDHAKSLTDSEFSLSCAALAMTCMDFINCKDVIIVSANRSITMNKDNILLSDPLTPQETKGG